MADLRRVEDVERRLASADCNSFIPGTLVLLADGNARPIEQVQLGDRVLATDPQSGEMRPQAVVAVITGEGNKRLVDITIDSGATLTATEGHPFWSATSGHWVAAGQLFPGTRVLDARRTGHNFADSTSNS
ncbi:Hint domain-containing protein [Actinokineospora enzanensis]|uniref:Hint domain-containing protein n=1 Tax=Actinokineospora enzanensis TaxID=155975 RepID=UPI00146F8F44|nr:Hint domain-containing protein [Actinokineospora enzanensis]